MSKKIYFVVHNFSYGAGGGVNRVVSETANELAKDKDVDVNILSLADLDGGVAYPITENVKLHSLRMKKHSTTQYKGILKFIWLLLAYINILKFYTKEKTSCAWNLTSPPLIIVYSLLPKFKNIFINCEHISPQHKKTNLIIDKVRKNILNVADVTISLNKSDDQYYLSKGIKSQLIHNGVKFPEKLNENNEKIIIFVGRFEDQKNPLAALNIFYKSNLWGNGYKLKFFGYGKYHNDILDFAEKYSIAEHMQIISDEINPDNIYSNAACLIMTSRYEGLPMVLIEAMSRGIPCISYNCPQGPAEIIKNDINGYLIPIDNEELFIEKLKSIQYFNFNKQALVNSVLGFNIASVAGKWKGIINKLDFCGEKQK